MSDPYPLSPELAAEIDAKINRPQPCNEHGDRIGDGYLRPAWTPKAFLIRGDRLMLRCRVCGHEAEAPAQALVDSGRGDLPWSAFSGKWKCEALTPAGRPCGSRDIELRLDLARERR